MGREGLGDWLRWEEMGGDVGREEAIMGRGK